MVKLLNSFYIMDDELKEIELIHHIKCDKYIKDEYVKSQLNLIELMRTPPPPDFAFAYDYSVDDIRRVQQELKEYKEKHPDFMAYTIIINDKFKLEFSSEGEREKAFNDIVSNMISIMNKITNLSKNDMV